MTTCTNHPSTLLQSLYHSGLTIRDAVVLEALTNNILPDYGDSIVILSKFEIAKITGLSPTSVQEATNRLRVKGLIAREQMTKKKGCVAQTCVMPAGMALIRGGHAPAMPTALCQLLVMETDAVVAGVAQAWEEESLLPMDLASDWRGGDERWRVLDAMLSQRALAASEAMLVAAQEEEALQAKVADGYLEVPLSSGESLTIHGPSFGATLDLPPTQVDIEFAVDVVARMVRKGRVVTRNNCSSLLAEAAYSRAKGFVREKPFRDGVHILASVMCRNSWSTPRSMPESWYIAAKQAFSPLKNACLA